MPEHKEEWTLKHEQVLNRWREISKYYEVMHDRSGKQYRWYDKVLAFPAFIFGAMNGLISLSSLNEDCNGRALMLTIAIFSGLSMGLFGYHRHMNYKGFSRRHFLASTKYHGLVLDIEEQLSHHRSMRSNVKYFFKRVKGTLTSIRKEAPDVPLDIFKRYVKDLNKTFNLDIQPMPEQLKVQFYPKHPNPLEPPEEQGQEGKEKKEEEKEEEDYELPSEIQQDFEQKREQMQQVQDSIHTLARDGKGGTLHKPLRLGFGLNIEEPTDFPSNPTNTDPLTDYDKI